MHSDRDDWDAALGGDGRAYERIFTRHVARVRRHAIGLSDTAADAEDVVAVTFFEAWRHRDRVRFVDGSLLPWLLATATNVGRNTARASRRYAAALARLPHPEGPPDPAEAASDTDRAIRALPLGERQVAVLCLVEGFSERETAQALGIRAGTVKSRLSRARTRLRAELRETHTFTQEEIGHGI